MEIVCCKRYELARKIKFTFYWAFWTLKKLNSCSISFLLDFLKLEKIHSCVWSLAKNWIHLLNFLSLQKDELNNFWACLSLQKGLRLFFQPFSVLLVKCIFSSFLHTWDDGKRTFSRWFFIIVFIVFFENVVFICGNFINNIVDD